MTDNPRQQRPSQLVLVRHAESMRNQAIRGSVYFVDDEARQGLRGIPDHEVGLTESGRKHAAATGVALRDRLGTFDYVYHSGYRRTIETTDELLSAYTPDERAQMRVRHNTFIRERDPGFAFEMTEKEASAAFPWLQDYWRTFGGFMARPPGGESLADVAHRVHTFLDTLFRDRGGKRVLVVTHGGTIRCFRYLLDRWDYQQAVTWNGEPHPANCGVTVYDHDPTVGRLVLGEYNSVLADGSKVD